MSSANIIYTVVDGIAVRIPPHACQCDECKLLDVQDFESLRLAHEYLDNKLTLDDWRDAHVRNGMGENDVAINRFNRSIGAKSGPNGLSTMIDLLYYDWPEDDSPFDELMFRRLLRQLIEGYECRMRTVHLWHLVEKGKQ